MPPGDTKGDGWEDIPGVREQCWASPEPEEKGGVCLTLQVALRGGVAWIQAAVTRATQPSAAWVEEIGRTFRGTPLWPGEMNGL